MPHEFTVRRAFVGWAEVRIILRDGSYVVEVIDRADGGVIASEKQSELRAADAVFASHCVSFGGLILNEDCYA